MIVHGLAEHSGRYEHVGRRLAAAGFAALAFDLRGHGEAEGWPGNVTAPDEWLDDLGDALAAASTARPLFVIAHSMGTLVALASLAERGPQGVGGLVLSGTAVAPGKAILDSLGDPDAPGIPAALLSHDPEIVRAYSEDPLVFAANVPAECTAAAMACAARAFEGAPAIRVPVLLLHGGDDAICDPSGAREVYEALGSSDKSITIYNGLYHEIFNEIDRSRVLDDMIAWMDARI